jgi:MFS family permease
MLLPMVSDERFPSRSFLFYWRANAVSGFGTYVTLFALQALVVLTLHGSAAEVGWLNSVRWLPSLVVGVVVGALVDRHSRRPIMVTTDLVQAALQYWRPSRCCGGSTGCRCPCCWRSYWHTEPPQ